MTSYRGAISILLGVAILAYINAFYGAFQFDDFVTIFEDPHLKSPSTFISHLGHTIRPFLKLTFFLDLRLFGENPVGYHFLNFLLHLGSGIMVYKTLSIALNRTLMNSLSSKGVTTLPFWTALLFLVHPIETETVTYISGRATGLMAFFYLASFYLYILTTEAKENPKRFSLRYTGSLLCFILSLLSKEVAVTLPVTLLLYDIVLRRKRGSEMQNLFLNFHLPFWIILFLFLLTGWSNPQYSYLFQYSLEIRPLYENLLTQINTIAYALSLFFIPANLNFDHDLPLYHSILQWPILLSLAVLFVMIATALLSVRKEPFFAFGLFWFFLHLLPTNSFIPRNDLLSERNLYLPSIGLFLALVFLFIHLAKKTYPYFENLPSHVFRIATFGRRVIGFFPFLIALFLILSTINRNTVYKDQVTFWSDAVRKSPQKARPHNNLGYACYLKGDLNKAIEEFRIALSIDRYYPDAQQNLLRAWELNNTIKQKQD